MNSVALGLVLGQLVHLAPSGYTGTLSITDRTEVRSRTGVGGARIGFDTDNALGTNMNFVGRRTTFSLSYGARFTFFDIGGANNSLDIMQFGRLGYSWSSRKMQLSMSLDGSIGNQNSAALSFPVTLTDGTMGTPGKPTAPTAPVVPVQAPPGRLYMGSARASLGATYRFSRLWQTSASLFGGIGGGFDWPSQQANPPNRSVGANTSVGYTVSRTDLLSTTASGSYTYVLDTPEQPGATDKPGGKYLNLGLFESYSHPFNARTVGAAGLGFSHVRDASRSDNGNFFGSALLGLTYANVWQGATIATGGALAVGTIYNPIVAQVQQTASASFNLSYTVRKWSASASLGTATSIPLDTPGSSRSVSGGVGVAYLANEVVQLQTGVRMSAQVLPATAGQSLPPSYGGFVAVTLIAPPMRL